MGFEEIEKLAKILKEKDNFILASHLNYDSDALGSLISLGLILKKLNKNFNIYFEEELNEKFQFIPLKEKLTKNINHQEFDVSIILDCDRLLRTGEIFYSVIKNKFTILIDHHQTNLKDADFNIVLNTSSTTEIIYYLAKELRVDFDYNLATMLLLGILGDTLILTIEMEKEKFLNTLEIVKDLIEKEGNYNLIVQTLKTKSWFDFKILMNEINNSYLDGKILISVVENCEPSEIAYFLSFIKEAEVIVILKKKDSGTKISLRSKGDIDVGYLAKEYFNGGGHKNAAGGFLEMDLESATNFVLGKMKEYLNNVN